LLWRILAQPSGQNGLCAPSEAAGSAQMRQGGPGARFDARASLYYHTGRMIGLPKVIKADGRLHLLLDLRQAKCVSERCATVLVITRQDQTEGERQKDQVLRVGQRRIHKVSVFDTKESIFMFVRSRLGSCSREFAKMPMRRAHAKSALSFRADRTSRHTSGLS
jgi:hypothetical protein